MQTGIVLRRRKTDRAHVVSVGGREVVVDLMTHCDFPAGTDAESLVGREVEFGELIPCMYFALGARLSE